MRAGATGILPKNEVFITCDYAELMFFWYGLYYFPVCPNLFASLSVHFKFIIYGDEIV